MAKKKPAKKASRQSPDSAKPNRVRVRTRTKVKPGAASNERPSEATEPIPAGDCAATLERNNIDGTIAATLKAEKLRHLDGMVREELKRLLRGFEAELCEARRATSANAKLVNELEAYHRSMAAAISDAMKLLTLFPFTPEQGAKVREAAACLLLNADDAKPYEVCNKFFSCGGRVPAFGLRFRSHAEAVWHLVIVIADFVRDIDAKFDDRPFSVVVDQHSPVESPREEVLAPLRLFVVRLLEAIITRKWGHLPHPRRLAIAEGTEQPVKQIQTDVPLAEEQQAPTKRKGGNGWHHCGDDPPSSHEFGPLAGTKTELAKSVGYKFVRDLTKPLINGRYWGRVITTSRLCELYFKTADFHDKAKKALDDLRANRTTKKRLKAPASA